MSGCATNAAHKLTNTRKRLFPKATPIKVLTFDELDLLQALTDAKRIPQGEHLTAAERKQLTNFQIGGQTISEGDHIAVTGFIAEDRNIRCGGAESVNCGHSEPSGGDPACTRTDIHLPIVEQVSGHEVQSIVTEPIPQGQNVKVWTPAAFRELKKEGRRLLIRGGLFYDSGHIVNTDENSTTSQPKRFTLWEISGPIQAPRTSNPNDRAADARAVSCVAIAGSGPTRSRQISAVARCTASSVPSGIGSGSLARLRTGGRSSTRSIASSHSVTVRNLAAASSLVRDPWSRSRSIVRALSTAMSSLETRASYDRSSSRAPGSRNTMRRRAEVSMYVVTGGVGPRAGRLRYRYAWPA